MTTDLHPPCECQAAGFCPRAGKLVHENEHRICQAHDDENLARSRSILLDLWADHRKGQARDRAQESGILCAHLGPDTGELRECKTCQGNVRQKVFACAVYGDTTLMECKRCKDFVSAPESVTGLAPHNHDADHWALSFSKHATLALHDADGNADRSYADRWPGSTWFWLGGGPSLADVDLSCLAGRLTLAANGVCELYPRPTAWIAVDAPDDPPDRFPGVPWEDEAVLKLLPRALASCDAGGEPVCEQSGVRFFLRNGLFRPWAFLSERSVNWGGDKPYGSGRSVMLCSLRLLHYFGARRVVLLGADFRMRPEKPYAHSATKDERACESNNRKFEALDRRFAMLRPYLEKAGLVVVNATEGSHLQAFERVSLADELSR